MASKTGIVAETRLCSMRQCRRAVLRRLAVVLLQSETMGRWVPQMILYWIC